MCGIRSVLIILFCVDHCLIISAQTTILPCIGGLCPAGLICDTTTNRCVPSLMTTLTSLVPIITITAAPVPTIAALCVDKARPGGISDCPSNANLCNDPIYMELMTDQCPRTCNKCGIAAATRPPSGNFGNGRCVDLALPGKISDCPTHASLCTNSAYRNLMSSQCPRTCGLCSATGVPVVPVIGRK